MKKILRFLLILIVILLVGYLILCATGPSEMVAEKSTTINSSKDIVWNQVVNLKNWDNWSPWKEQDSTVTTTTTEPDGQVGTKYSYVGKKSGEGTMTIAAIEGTTMNYDMHFIKPFETDAKGWVKVEDENGSTKVTHHYAGPTPFMMRGMVTLFGKKMLEMSFARGLEMLKEYCESGKAGTPAPAYDIVEATFPATNFAMIRQAIKMTDVETFYKQSKAELNKAGAGIIEGNPHMVGYKWDEATGEADLGVAYVAKGPVKGASSVSIPESKGYMVVFNGPYSGMMAAHMAIGKYAAENGITDPLVIESYVDGEPEITDSNKYVTHIYYLKK